MTSKSMILVVGLLVVLALQISVVSDPKLRSTNSPSNSINQSGMVNHSTPCPTINVVCSSRARVGENISFEAVVQGGAVPSKPTYKWKVSDGRVIRGKGAATIIVSTRNVRPSEITALVKVGGFPNACPLTASCSLTLVKGQ
jgi:hypothetical protein